VPPLCLPLAVLKVFLLSPCHAFLWFSILHIPCLGDVLLRSNLENLQSAKRARIFRSQFKHILSPIPLFLLGSQSGKGLPPTLKHVSLRSFPLPSRRTFSPREWLPSFDRRSSLASFSVQRQALGTTDVKRRWFHDASVTLPKSSLPPSTATVLWELRVFSPLPGSFKDGCPSRALRGNFLSVDCSSSLRAYLSFFSLPQPPVAPPFISPVCSLPPTISLIRAPLTTNCSLLSPDRFNEDLGLLFHVRLGKTEVSDSYRPFGLKLSCGEAPPSVF